MSSHSTPSRLRACLPVLACFSLSLLLSPPAHASSGKKYVALRQQARCDRRLTYAAAQQNPAAYEGQTLELRGIVGGTAETQDGGLTLMLTLPDRSAVTLDIPSAEVATVKEYSTPTLRVLARIGSGAAGNVVPLNVLAVAHDSAVSAIEVEAAARTQARVQSEDYARSEQARWQSQTRRASRRSPAYASRGGYSRPMPSNGSSAALAATLPDAARACYPAYYEFIARQNPRLSEAQVGQITFHLLRCSYQSNLDPRLMVAMIIAESNFNPSAVSHSGATGLGQLMPGTARALGVNNPYDIAQNVEGSVNYLASRMNTFGSDMSLALAAYNAGAGAVMKYHGVPPYRETQAYVRKIRECYDWLCTPK